MEIKNQDNEIKNFLTAQLGDLSAIEKGIVIAAADLCEKNDCNFIVLQLEDEKPAGVFYNSNTMQASPMTTEQIIRMLIPAIDLVTTAGANIEDFKKLCLEFIAEGLKDKNIVFKNSRAENYITQLLSGNKSATPAFFAAGDMMQDETPDYISNLLPVKKLILSIVDSITAPTTEEKTQPAKLQTAPKNISLAKLAGMKGTPEEAAEMISQCEEVATHIEGAKRFFLENSTGALICMDGDRVQVVHSYPTAAAFFKAESKIE